MSEVRLNLIDSQTIIYGTIHGSIADAVIAALSAEPETIGELEAALERYDKRPPNFHELHGFSECPIDCSLSAIPGTAPSLFSMLDTRPYDAGIVIVDLAARIVAMESTYSQPGHEGQVNYHDGNSSTDIPILYRVPDDWLFFDSLDEFKAVRAERYATRTANPPLDARPVLYGRPLLEFIALTVHQSPDLRQALGCCDASQKLPIVNTISIDDELTHSNHFSGECACTAPVNRNDDKQEFVEHSDDDSDNPLARAISDIHARWLLTPRDDLRGQSPRDVMLARQDFIDFDLHTRLLQWSIQLEGPPCLSTESFAYRFAGFGSHEWIVYYDLVRELLWRAAADFRLTSDVGQPLLCRDVSEGPLLAQNGSADNDVDKLKFVGHSTSELEAAIVRLEQIKTAWLEQPQQEFDGHIPALIIDNERRRLPEAMGGRTMVIDEECPVCKMIGDEAESGLGIYFWGLDGCNMDDAFPFSSFHTFEEWEEERLRRKLFSREFNQQLQDREERIARGEILDPDPLFDPIQVDELPDWRAQLEPDIPDS